MGDKIISAGLLAVFCAAIGYGVYKFSGKPDTPVEEAAEAVIERQLGMPVGLIDLSPESEEE